MLICRTHSKTVGILLPLLKTQAKSDSFFSSNCACYRPLFYKGKRSEYQLAKPNDLSRLGWVEKNREGRRTISMAKIHIYSQLLSSVELLAVGIPLPWPEQKSDFKINYLLTKIPIHSRLWSSMELYNCEYTIAVAENPGEKWLGVCFFRATVQGCRALLFCRRRWSESQLAFC